MKGIASIIFSSLLFVACQSTKQSTEHTNGYIQVKDSKIYYQVQGKGNALVLAHAGFMDHNMWQKQVDEFCKDFKVITLDMPAHGLSVKGDSTFLMQEAFNILLDSLNINKASFAGLSLGSVAVTDYIIAYPERVHKAILISPGINGWDTKYPLDTMAKLYFNDLMDALNKKDSAAAAEVFTHYWSDGPFRSPNDYNKSVRDYVYQTTLGNIKKHKVSGWPRFATPPAIEKIDGIKVPVLIINGDKDLNYITEASKVLNQSIKGSKLVNVKNVAHMVNMEKPEEFNRIVYNFLKG